MSGILICGAGGQVGQAVTLQLRQAGREVVTLDRRALDIADPTAIEGAFAAHRPEVVVNAAAYTAVDRAESEPDIAYSVNADGPRRLAEACAKIGAALVSYSTEHVFDGTKSSPYTESDPIAPINLYGLSKAKGEDGIRASLQRHIILRTSWVFSPGRPNYVTTMLRLGSERDVLRIVDDVFGCPTPAWDIATATVGLIDAVAGDQDISWGTYHFCGAGPVSRYRLTQLIMEDYAMTAGRTVEVAPIKDADFPTAAKRPLKAILDCSKIARTFGLTQPDWRGSIKQVVEEFQRNRMADQ